MNYEQLTEGIEKSGMTQAPALLACAVQNAIDKGAFKDAWGLLAFVTKTVHDHQQTNVKPKDHGP